MGLGTVGRESHSYQREVWWNVITIGRVRVIIPMNFFRYSKIVKGIYLQNWKGICHYKGVIDNKWGANKHKHNFYPFRFKLKWIMRWVGGRGLRDEVIFGKGSHLFSAG